MKQIHIAIAVVALLTQAFLPATASARQVAETRAASPFDFPVESALGAAQGPQTPPRSRAGELMLRNALIGAAIGAGVLGTFVVAAGGDCGNCTEENVKTILSGAMYGALFGAAIRLYPSRRPTPGQPSRKPTFSPQITKHVKAMNVHVRF